MIEEKAIRWLQTHPERARTQAKAQDGKCMRCEGPLDCWIPVFTRPPKEFTFICATCSEVSVH